MITRMNLLLLFTLACAFVSASRAAEPYIVHLSHEVPQAFPFPSFDKVKDICGSSESFCVSEEATAKVECLFRGQETWDNEYSLHLELDPSQEILSISCNNEGVYAHLTDLTVHYSDFESQVWEQIATDITTFTKATTGDTRGVKASESCVTFLPWMADPLHDITTEDVNGTLHFAFQGEDSNFICLSSDAVYARTPSTPAQEISSSMLSPATDVKQVSSSTVLKQDGTVLLFNKHDGLHLLEFSEKVAQVSTAGCMAWMVTEQEELFNYYFCDSDPSESDKALAQRDNITDIGLVPLDDIGAVKVHATNSDAWAFIIPFDPDSLEFDYIIRTDPYLNQMAVGREVTVTVEMSTRNDNDPPIRFVDITAANLQVRGHAPTNIDFGKVDTDEDHTDSFTFTLEERYFLNMDGVDPRIDLNLEITVGFDSFTRDLELTQEYSEESFSSASLFEPFWATILLPLLAAMLFL